MTQSIIPAGTAQAPTPAAPQPRSADASVVARAAGHQAHATPRAEPRDTPAPKAQTTLGNSVQVSLDKESGKPVVRVVDGEGQLVRQIPTEEVLELRRALDRVTGLLVDKKA